METNLALSFQGAAAEFKTRFISTRQGCKSEAVLVVDPKRSEIPTRQSQYQSSNKKKTNSMRTATYTDQAVTEQSSL